MQHKVTNRQGFLAFQKVFKVDFFPYGRRGVILLTDANLGINKMMIAK